MVDVIVSGGGTTSLVTVTDTRAEAILYPRYPKNSVTIVSGALVLSFALGGALVVNLTENVTSVSLQGFPDSTESQVLKVYFIQDGTGGRTVAGWPGSVLWPGGDPPVITSAANAVDCLIFDTIDGGTTFFGARALADVR